MTSLAEGISCPNGRYIPISYICDYEQDCSDGADEDIELCKEWRTDACASGSVACTRHGNTSCMEIETYCTSKDPPCDVDLDLRVCEIILNKVVTKLPPLDHTDPALLHKNAGKSSTDEPNATDYLAEEFSVMVNRSISHPQCPSMFTLVGHQCLSLFFIGSVSWSDSRAFCKVLGGDLVTLKNVSQFAALITHLRNSQMTADFWVGGHAKNASQGWTWLDDTLVDLRSPFWAVRYETSCENRTVTFPELNVVRWANNGTCYHYQRAPRSPTPVGECVALTYQHYYHMTDEECPLRKSPLCALPVGQFPTDLSPK
ncbi:uncharacterized protein [Procambarus clarkii]|uniref:uncharacterized protein n=1 Tax=Procambarus clarkii TaxID=6728 RepID=UPI003743D746